MASPQPIILIVPHLKRTSFGNHVKIFFIDWIVFLMSATTLTSWHLLVTFCSLHVALWMKLFEHKPFDPRAVMGFGILNGTSIGLLNLSLGFNSVGFYQVGFLNMHWHSCLQFASFKL